MTAAEISSASVVGRPRRLVRRTVAWLLALVLLATVGVWAWHRADLPPRIVIQSRDYHQSNPVSSAFVRKGSGTWQRVGAAGLRHRPVFAFVIRGAAPTLVFIRLSSERLMAYELAGGP